MNMIVSKRHIILASLVVALGIAVYLNWAFSSKGNDLTISGKVDEDKTYGEAQFTNADGKDAEAFFASARVEKKKSREEALETLNKMVKDSKLSKEDTDLLKAQATGITDNMMKETKIETLLKAKGFNDCIVYVDNDKAYVIVKTPGLLSTENAQIKDIMLTETKLDAKNVKIVEAK